ncbi:hypothetical protein [Glaciimonas sp. Gout2]|nr:hypothetical protein [Glaciimonas sp. Gout2]
MMIGKRSYFHIFLMTVSASLVISCSEDKTVRQLHSSDGKATFTLPQKYETNNTNTELITFAFHYPDMAPITQGSAPKKDEIKIYLSRTTVSDFPRINDAENMEKNAIDQFDPSRRGLEYRVENRGIYRRYQQGNPKELESLSTYYIFQAADGQPVAIKDPLPFIVSFKALRTIDDHFDLQYTIAKPIGKDFIKIDQVVTDLIKKNITIASSSEE